MKHYHNSHQPPNRVEGWQVLYYIAPIIFGLVAGTLMIGVLAGRQWMLEQYPGFMFWWSLGGGILCCVLLVISHITKSIADFWASLAILACWVVMFFLPTYHLWATIGVGLVVFAITWAICFSVEIGDVEDVGEFAAMLGIFVAVVAVTSGGILALVVVPFH